MVRARAEVLEAVEELLRNTVASDAGLDREARLVYNWLLDEHDERGVEQAIRRQERELRRQGLRIGNRKEYRNEWLSAARKVRRSYTDWKFGMVE